MDHVQHRRHNRPASGAATCEDRGVSALEELEAVARGAARPPAPAPGDRERIAAAREVIESALQDGTPVYGVTTGFGRLASVRIPAADAAQLQLNLVRSHAVGAGPPLAEDVVRGMLLLLGASLRRGHSGVRPELIDLVHALLERGVTPVVPSKGSVGSSGDLAPLAHLALVLVGEGEATVDGAVLPGAEALARAGLKPLALTAKEGLALINGTHLMAAAGGLAVREAQRLIDAAVVATALSLEAFKGSTVPFDARLHALRRQPGQLRVAATLRRLLAGSPVVASHADCGRVQDPYTLRCAPQVIGAIADAVDYAAGALERELEAVTDNPLVFPGDGEVLSGGNFHGQPLSLPLDHLALAMCELASFSERRTYALLSPSYAELPPFLTPRPGLSSGLMIAQYAAAALVSECQVLSHPAGAGSIPTSAGQEDFNSMGALAALKARTVVENASHVIATELVCAVQGLEFHRPLCSTDALERAAARVRAMVPRVEEDRSLAGELARLAGALRTGELVLEDAPSPEEAHR
jgi:histidine ammonia-lyase